jgi:16S rRNA (uracil1498-N3)-methyltransferase
MDRIYVSPESVNGGAVLVDGDAHRHLAKSLRVRPGDRFAATDGVGRELTLEVELVDRRAVRARVLDERRIARAPASAVTLAVAPPKGDRLDVAIEKACEIGVGRIVPLVTERSVVRMDGDSKRLERWRRIARAAMVQSAQAWEADIAEPHRLDALLGLRGAPDAGGRVLLAHPAPDAVTVREALRGCTDREPVLILVGPEGGFTDDESLRARRGGAVAVSLGDTRLRTETAAVVAAALAADALAPGSFGRE